MHFVSVSSSPFLQGRYNSITQHSLSKPDLALYIQFRLVFLPLHPTLPTPFFCLRPSHVSPFASGPVILIGSKSWAQETWALIEQIAGTGSSSVCEVEAFSSPEHLHLPLPMPLSNNRPESWMGGFREALTVGFPPPGRRGWDASSLDVAKHRFAEVPSPAAWRDSVMMCRERKAWWHDCHGYSQLCWLLESVDEDSGASSLTCSPMFLIQALRIHLRTGGVEWAFGSSEVTEVGRAEKFISAQIQPRALSRFSTLGPLWTTGWGGVL